MLKSDVLDVPDTFATICEELIYEARTVLVGSIVSVTNEHTCISICKSGSDLRVIVDAGPRVQHRGEFVAGLRAEVARGHTALPQRVAAHYAARRELGHRADSIGTIQFVAYFYHFGVSDLRRVHTLSPGLSHK